MALSVVCSDCSSSSLVPLVRGLPALIGVLALKPTRPAGALPSIFFDEVFSLV
jgi:hypothetical protein